MLGIATNEISRRYPSECDTLRRSLVIAKPPKDLRDSFDRERIDGRSSSARNDQPRTSKHKLINAVSRTIFCQFLNVEDFSHRQPHRWNDNPVPWLSHLRRFVGSNFNTPRIRTDCSDGLSVRPIAILKLD